MNRKEDVMAKKEIVINGGGAGSTLFIVFLILKLCGVIDWSWWWVTAPLWVIPAIILGFMLAFVIVALLIVCLGGLKSLIARKPTTQPKE